VRKRSGSKCFDCAKAKRQQHQKRLIGRPQEALLCAKAKRQQQMFSVAKAKRQQQMFSVAKAKRQLQMFFLCESEATATNVFSVRKRSDSNKAPSRNGNQPHVLLMIQLNVKNPK